MRSVNAPNEPLRIALMTPLRDGMNLVAKEFIAAQDPKDPGVLILSRFAGAACQLKEALLVNPFSAEELSDAIRTALAMPLAERIARWNAMYDNIQREDVLWWRRRFADALVAKQDRPTSNSGRDVRHAVK